VGWVEDFRCHTRRQVSRGGSCPGEGDWGGAEDPAKWIMKNYLCQWVSHRCKSRKKSTLGALKKSPKEKWKKESKLTVQELGKGSQSETAIDRRGVSEEWYRKKGTELHGQNKRATGMCGNQTGEKQGKERETFRFTERRLLGV